MKKEYTIKLEFHENGRLKSLENKYLSEYGSISDVLTEDVTNRIARLILVNREDTENNGLINPHDIK